MNSDLKPDHKPIHKGTITSCILVAIVHNRFSTVLMPNFPFIIRGYKDHVK